MMISYSKVIKAPHISLMEEVKVISQPNSMVIQDEEINSNNPGEGEGNDHPSLQGARAQAQEIIDMAEEKVCSLEAAAKEKINQWWEENQKKLEAMSLDAKQQGFNDGFLKGKHEAEEQIQQQYQSKLDQASQLLEQAYEQKEAIILESEPFLLELSTVIASQIIKQELESSHEKFVDLIKQHILRVKEKEHITVCVNPDDFDFIQSQRDHLLAVVNGDTEIKIIPDHSVSSKGCIIRTAYGSIDARIDTQIEEIKKAVLDVRRELDSETIN